MEELKVQMTIKKLLYKFLPFLVGGLGALISFVLWLFLTTNAEWAVGFGFNFEDYQPYIALILGFSFSILIGIIIHIAQLAHQRSITVDKINENLKTEIAERLSAEETKQKLEYALLQGQKLQAIGTLAGGIAHDFNNLLYAVIGYVEMSQEDVGKDSITYKNLAKVLEAAHRGQELIARILAFSRRQHHEFEVINLKTTIEAALALLRPTIPASVTINFQAIEIYVLGNQTQIHQVLVNIINNAVDAMDGEGTIDIVMSRIPPDDPLLNEFPEVQAQNYCKIEIKDTGYGMDQRTVDRIFEPFFTTKEVGKGTGLGLSIVHSIIKEHEGEITVKSQLGHGSNFIIFLPEYVMQ